MSTLFGHVKGAFTGALKDRPGLLRAADRGLLFLDEIGELGLDEQAMLLRAIEERSFLPLGADEPSSSEFQLICGTNRDLGRAVREGRFREDLLARINLWAFHLPGLRERREDLEPNLEYELDRWAEVSGQRVTFNREARNAFLAFATSPVATWQGNFRDFNAALMRMATLAEGGRIGVAGVREEIARLQSAWSTGGGAREGGEDLQTLLPEMDLGPLDRFDEVQLTEVVRVCRRSGSLSDAGRQLFSVSRAKKQSSNDADRLRKYLGRFGLSWTDVSGRAEPTLTAAGTERTRGRNAR
jgi:transcriptional regulatory protein RtcR